MILGDAVSRLETFVWMLNHTAVSTNNGGAIIRICME